MFAVQLMMKKLNSQQNGKYENKNDIFITLELKLRRSYEYFSFLKTSFGSITIDNNN